MATIREIAANDSDPQIRRMATQNAPAAHQQRLVTFTQRIRRQHVVRQHPQFVLAPDLDLGQPRPPKPAWLIRIVLERIQRLVRGHLSQTVKESK